MKDKKEPVRFTMYIPVDLNEKIEFLRYKERTSKNKIILKGAAEYVSKQIKKYPDYEKVKDV